MPDLKPTPADQTDARPDLTPPRPHDAVPFRGLAWAMTALIVVLVLITQMVPIAAGDAGAARTADLVPVLRQCIRFLGFMCGAACWAFALLAPTWATRAELGALGALCLAMSSVMGAAIFA